MILFAENKQTYVLPRAWNFHEWRRTYQLHSSFDRMRSNEFPPRASKRWSVEIVESLSVEASSLIMKRTQHEFWIGNSTTNCVWSSRVKCAGLLLQGKIFRVYNTFHISPWGHSVFTERVRRPWEYGTPLPGAARARFFGTDEAAAL